MAVGLAVRRLERLAVQHLCRQSVDRHSAGTGKAFVCSGVIRHYSVRARSLQVCKHRKHRVWVAKWWQDGGRRSKVLGRCSQMTTSDAEAALSEILKPINSGVLQGPRPLCTFKEFVTDQYLPFYRKGWKESTAGTSQQIITTHLIPELGDVCSR